MMKPVKIAVFMRDSQFARALARGLAESGNRFLVEVLEAAVSPEIVPENCPWEVLVTDLWEKNGAERDSEPSGVVHTDWRTCRVSELSREILHQAALVREACQPADVWRKEKTGRTKAVGVYGLCGGCGTTAVAVTVGRMLSGAYGERVLYVPLAKEEDGRVYREAEEETGDVRRRQGKELLYRMAHGLPYSLEAFLYCDSYGLEQLQDTAGLSAAERQELFSRLLEDDTYDWILLDLGSGFASDPACLEKMLPGRMSAADRCICLVEVRNRLDSRCGLDESYSMENGNRRILVWNHSLKNQAGGLKGTSAAPSAAVILEIAHDAESFLPDRSTGRVEIVMSKTFAIGIKNLTEILMERPSDFVDSWRLMPNGVES